MNSGFAKTLRRFSIPFLCYFALAFAYFSKAFVMGLLIAPEDSWLENFPLRFYYATSFFRHGQHLWLPYEFLGLPFLGTLQTGLLYPLNLIYFIFPAAYAFNLSLILHYALAASFTFIYVKQLGKSTLAASLAGVAFAFSGFMMAHKDHVSMLNAAVWLPLILLCYEKLRITLNLKYSLAAALLVAVQILAGHFQICLQTYMVLGLFALFFVRRIEPAPRKRFLFLALLPVLLGSMIALPQLVSSYELARRSTHTLLSYEYMTDSSLPPWMIPILIFPFFFGGGYGVEYWGVSRLTETAGFACILPLAIALWFSVKAAAKRQEASFFLILAAGSFLLVLGKYTPIYRLIVYTPILNLFRIPTRHWFEFDFAIAILFAFGLDELLLHQRENVSNFWKIQRFALVLGFLGIAAAVGERLFFLSHPSVISQEISAGLKESLRFGSPALLVPIAFLIASVIWLFAASRPAVKLRWISIWLALMIAAESFSFGGFHESEWPKISEAAGYLDSPIMQVIKNQKSPGRFAYTSREDNTSLSVWPLLNVPYRLEMLNGYDPLMIRELSELVEMLPFGITRNWSLLLPNNVVLSLLNVKYLIVPNDALPPGITNLKTARLGVAPSYVSKLTDEWKLSYAYRQGGSYALAPPDDRHTASMSQKITLRPKTLYMLSFLARADKKGLPKIYFDLRTPDREDFGRLRLEVDSNYLTQDSKKFFRVVRTGDKVANPLFARIYTSSSSAIEVKDPRVVELTNYAPPVLSDQSPGGKASSSFPLYKKIAEMSDLTLFENRNCMHRVFSVLNVKPATDLLDVKEKLYLLAVDPSKIAFVYNSDLPTLPQTTFSPGTAKIVDEQTDKITLEADFKGNGFLVLADQYYPGWKALIDDRDTRIYQVDGVLRGIVVPPGRHTIVFKYAPRSLYIASLIGFVMLLFTLTLLWRSASTDGTRYQ